MPSEPLLPIPDDPAPTGPLSLRPGPMDRFDRWTLWLVLAVAVLQLCGVRELRPAMSDTWYHVTVGEQIAEHGLFGWDEWRYAPLGRPHVYPPLLHLLLAALSGLLGGIIPAGQLCAVVFLPLAMLTTWYCARRLLGTREALLATLLLLTDFALFIIMQAYIASCLTNILLPLLMLTLVCRRPWWSILLMTLLWYSHLGMAPCVAVGLVVFGLIRREYLRLALKVIGISLLFFTPWLSHVLGSLDWLVVLEEKGVPGSLLDKLLILQAINFVLLGLGIRGYQRLPRTSLLRGLSLALLVGFIPILFSYGGRYFMHTTPVWAMLGSTVLLPLLPVAATRRRAVGVMLLPLLPLPTLSFMGGGPVPLPITGAHCLLITAVGRPLLGGQERKSEAYQRDCDELAAWLKANTFPDDIIHVNIIWVAEMISLLTHRRTDLGHWWECSKESAMLYGRNLRDWEPRAVFVYVSPDADTGSILGQNPLMPGVDRKFEIGRLKVGIREPHRYRATGGPRGWRALAAPGAESWVSETPTGFVWTMPAGKGTLGLVSVPLNGACPDAFSFRISASETTGDLVLGVHLMDGTDLRWPLSIAEPGVQYRVRAPLRWMTDAYGGQREPGPVRDVYLARPPDKVAGKGKQRELRVEVSEFRELTEWPPVPVHPEE